jgi:hypothetical protein
MKTNGEGSDPMDTRSRQPSASFQNGDLVCLEFLADVKFADEDGGNAQVVLRGHSSLASGRRYLQQKKVGVP